MNKRLGQNRTRIAIFVPLIIVFGLVGHGASQSSDSERVIPFRYVFIENSADIDEETGKETRVVEVLMDEKAFSEANLQILFDLISNRYENAEILDVTVHTNLEQAPTPEERDGGGSSNRPYNERDMEKLKYLWAIYIRTEISEFFRYSPRHDVYDIVTVEIRKLGTKRSRPSGH